MPATLADDLLRPDAYPWRPDRVERIETHISWVFLAGDRVVKIKRPVRLPFVDQSTPERRRAICEAEVRLNRRLTDDVYLGAVPITRGPHGHGVDGAGEPVDWATLMRRLPADRMLDELLQSRGVPEAWVERLADHLVAFNRDVAPPCEGTPEGIAQAATRVVTDNVDELDDLMRGRPFAVELGLVTDAVREFVDGHGDLLLARARDGWVREGHGDLRAEHICIEADSSVQVFDCVEFSRDIRCADIASDLAFLLMDLDRLGVPQETSSRLVMRYREAGLALPPELLGLYWVHRALVRAKVGAIRMAESDADDDSAMLGDVATWLHTAARRAVACGPVVIAMTGLSGTGKSTVAGRLARVLGAEHHRSDEVRKALAGVEGAAAAAFGEGIYREDMTAATYDRLQELGAAAIDGGRSVILDATYLDGEQREAVAAMARQRGVPFLLVETVTDREVLERRLAGRSAAGNDLSDADVAIMRRQREQLATSPVPVPDGALMATIDTSPEGYVDLDPALAALRGAGVVTSRITGVTGPNR